MDLSAKHETREIEERYSDISHRNYNLLPHKFDSDKDYIKYLEIQYLNDVGELIRIVKEEEGELEDLRSRVD